MQNYLQPAVGQTITIPVQRHRFVPYMVVFHQYGGYYRVAENTTPTSLALINLGVTSTLPFPLGYSNPNPGTFINNTNAIIQPAGELGGAGEQGRPGAKGDPGQKGDTGAAGLNGTLTAGYASPGSGGIGGTCGTKKCGYDARNLGVRICKTLHGYTAGQVLRISQNFISEFELADATSFDSAAAIGIVQCVIDEDTFVLITNGRVEFLADQWPEWAPDGLYSGSIYYLSDIPGQLSLTPGTEKKALFIGYTDEVGFFNTYSAGSGGGGSNGKNAFTITLNAFVQPDALQTVAVSVVDSSFAGIGQVLYIEGAGYYIVSAKPSMQQLVLINLGYPENTIPSTSIQAGAEVSPAGVRGNDGAKGNSGDNGTDGRTLLNGTVAPTIEGEDGDFYIDTVTDFIYGPKTGGLWGSPVPLIGPAGKTILNGIVAPTSEGVDGDFYLKTNTSELYGPKTAGVWGSPVSLLGANGKTILNGTAVPTTQGVDGDFYLKTDTSDLYGPKSGTWGSPVSLIGTAGKTVLNGVVNPTTEGVDGDFYINTATDAIFGPKAGGVWGAGTSLVGPQGLAGLDALSSFVEVVNNKEYVLNLYAANPGVITSVSTQLGAGTCTVRVYINGVAVGTAINTTTALQTQVENIAIVSNDKITFAVTSNVGGLDLSVSVGLQ